MSPNYGTNDPGADEVPDWLLGGNRKRRLLAALARQQRRQGWTAAQLSVELSCGLTTAHELLRGLRPIGLLEEHPGGGERLARSNELGRAVRAMIKALGPLEGQTVERPPRERRRGQGR
jgi:DNA-binding IclR family transcriptional regulator